MIRLILRPIYRSFQALRARTTRHKSLKETLEYWQQPNNGRNNPNNYIASPKAHARSKYLLEIIKRYTNPEAKILELGCGAGRNLNYLFEAGFRNLEGIEINKNAVKLFNKSYPNTAQHTTIHIKSIEETLSNLKDNAFDVVLTMAVLQHIHYQSEWIFPEITRITKSFLIIVENENYIHWRHFPRNYKRVFESLGMEQLEVISNDMLVRVFTKAIT